MTRVLISILFVGAALAQTSGAEKDLVKAM